jgi:hypothetical protein
MESASIPTCNFRIRKVFLAQVSNPKISNAIPLITALFKQGRISTDQIGRVIIHRTGNHHPVECIP